MSQFDFPRIHVKGQFYFNPGTANNDSIDPVDAGALTANTETVQPVTNGMSDGQFKQWLETVDPKTKFLNGQWNIYGDMGFWFDDVKVHTVQTAHNKIVTDDSEFGIIGSTLSINKAFALDVNPEGFSSTQVFCDSFSLRKKNDNDDEDSWVSRKPSRGATRWINWYRNLSYHGLPESSGAAGGVSTTWQMAFEIKPGDIDLSSKESNPNCLNENLKKVYDMFPGENHCGCRLKGMIFRMNVYLCGPLYSDTTMASEFFSKGIPQDNPAIGKVVGTFGPWYEHEMQSITLSRFLNSNISFANPYSTRPSPGNQAYLAPVLAFVNEKENIVSLDLSNTFPEDGKEGEKFVMGSATLQILSTAEKEIKSIGNFIYDRNQFESTSGLVDIRYDTSMLHDIKEGLLAISLDNYREGPLLLENELMIATDQSCVYLNEDKPRNRKIIVRACYKGGALPFPVTIQIEQWKATPSTLFPLIPKCLQQSSFVIRQNGFSIFKTETLDGPGVRVFRFIDPKLADKRLNIITDFMCTVRVLPKNDCYKDIKDEDLNFDLIYREIFRYYYLSLPAMNKRLPMNDPNIWNTRAAAEYVLKRSQEKLWDEYEYMPRTRDLSYDRRELLHRFCNKIIQSISRYQ